MTPRSAACACLAFALSATGFFGGGGEPPTTTPLTPSVQPTLSVPADGTPLVIEGRLEEGDAKQVGDGTFYDTYTIVAPAGRLMVQLNSNAFDPYLIVRAADDQGVRFRVENDDGPDGEGFGLDAFIERRLESGATLRVAANSTREGTGPYRLALSIRAEGERADLLAESSTLADRSFRAWEEGEAYHTVRALNDALDINRRLYPNDHQTLLANLMGLAEAQRRAGALDSARSAAEQAVAMSYRLFTDEESHDHLHLASSLGVQARVHAALGEFPQAEELAMQAATMARRLASHEGVDPDAAMFARLNDLAVLLAQLGRASDALPLLEEALDLQRASHAASTHQHQALTAALLHNIGAIHQRLGQLDRAAAFLREALDLRRRLYQHVNAADHPDLASSLNGLGLALLSLGSTEEAKSLLESALEMRRRLLQGVGVEDHPDLAESLANLAAIHQAEGQHERAEALFEAALAIHRRAFQREGSGCHPLLLGSLCNLAVLHADRNPERAERLLEQALEMADRLRLRTRGDIESRALMAQEVALPEISNALARVRISLEQPEAAFDALEVGRARAVMDLFEREARGGLDAVVGALPDELRSRIEQARRTEEICRMAAARAEAALAASLNQGGLHAESRKQLRDDAVRARSALGDAMVATNRALGQSMPSLRARTSADLRDSLRPGELLLSIAWLGDVATVISISQDGSTGDVLFGSANDRTGRMRQLGATIDRLARELRTPLEFDRSSLQAAVALIPAAVEERIRSARRVVVINSGRASRIPADLLVAQINSQAEVLQAHSATQFLDRRRLAIEREEARESAGPSVPDAAVIVAYPQYADSAPTPPNYGPEAGGSIDASSRRHMAYRSLDAYRLLESRLAELPGTRAEAAFIGASLDAAGLPEGERRVTLLGPSATIPNLRTEISRLRPRVLHIATHGIIGASEDPLDAALALTPSPEDFGFLTLDSLLREWPGRLDGCDLVVLSACDTGWGARKGDTEFGLPWGFFLSGATSVVASLWQVDDVSTALLMARFHEGRLGSFDAPRTIRGRTFKSGQRMATLDSLDEAKQWLRTLTREQVGEALALARRRGTIVDREAGAPQEGHGVNSNERPYEHPYYWAAFVLFGSPQ